MASPNPFISIIVPNFNGVAHIEKCLSSALSAAEQFGKSFELILVDDASLDNSVDFVRARFPQIKLLCAGQNHGFSKTCNRGASQGAGEWLFFLNNDCYLSKNYFTQIFEASAKLPQDLFSLMGGILNLDGKLVDAAKFPEVPSGNLWRGIKSTLNVEASNEILPTFFSSGCNLLVKRDKFLELGGFDELYSPFYLEDVDLGMSAWRRGWTSYYIPQATCVHEGSSTISKIPSTFVRSVSKRNRWIFHLKHLPLRSMIPWVLIHGAEIGIGLFLKPRLYFFLLSGLFPRLQKIRAARAAFAPNTSAVLAKIQSQIETKKSLRFF